MFAELSYLMRVVINAAVRCMIAKGLQRFSCVIASVAISNVLTNPNQPPSSLLTAAFHVK